MLEVKVRNAIVLELQWQLGSDPPKLRIEDRQERMTVNGDVDLLALATAVVGAVAGAL